MTFIIFIFFVPILVSILLIINTLFAPSRPDAEKNSSYESGFIAITGQTRIPFSIIYYLVAILFLVFDLEVIILLPFSTCISNLGSYGF